MQTSQLAGGLIFDSICCCYMSSWSGAWRFILLVSQHCGINSGQLRTPDAVHRLSASQRYFTNMGFETRSLLLLLLLCFLHLLMRLSPSVGGGPLDGERAAGH